MNIDQKDSHILYELGLDARSTVTDIAKKLGYSKQVVSYRINLLEERGMIKSYSAITNIHALGKTHYRVFLKYQNMNTEIENDFMQYLNSHPKIVWIAYFDGDLDAAYLVWAKNIQEFEEVYEEVNNKFGKYFAEKHFSVATKIEYLKHKIFSDKYDSSSIVFGGGFAQKKIDSLDAKILSELNINGRATLVEIASKLHVSPEVVGGRIEKLEYKKVILGYKININYNLLGLTHRKVLLSLNNFSKEKIKNFEYYLRKHKNTIYLVRPIGYYDYEFELLTETNREFHDIIKEIRSKFSDLIKNYDTVIHFKEPKSGQSSIF